MVTYCFKDVDGVCYNFVCPCDCGRELELCDGCPGLRDCSICINEDCPLWRCE